MNWDDISMELERLAPSSLAASLDRDRPYDGQPHTDTGDRGATKIKGLTFRDLRDCFIRACYESSGLPIEEWPGSVYDLPWRDMDILAVSQNLSCNVEKYMGIYPNVPRCFPTDPRKLHWCGWPIDNAVWTSHEGRCPGDNRSNKPDVCVDCEAPLVKSQQWTEASQDQRDLWKSWGWKKYAGRGRCARCSMRKAREK